MSIPRWRQKQMRDRLTRIAQVRRAGEKSRQLEREVKERLAAETAAVLAHREAQLRKRPK